MDNNTKTARNKANFLAAKEAFNRKDIVQCLQYYSLDHEVKSAGAGKGRHVIQSFLEGMLATWDDITISAEHVVAEDNWVMARSVATATHSNTVMGVKPTHKKIAASFWDLHLFDDEGVIIQSWNLVDNAAIMKQIGMLQ